MIVYSFNFKLCKCQLIIINRVRKIAVLSQRFKSRKSVKLKETVRNVLIDMLESVCAFCSGKIFTKITVNKVIATRKTITMESNWM